MRTHRIGQLFALVAALAATACGSSQPPVASTRGSIQASIAAPPASVKAVLVVVSAADLASPLRATLSDDGSGHWSGRVLDVPPGLGRAVTAYAYDRLAVPADPEADQAGLVYKGQRTNVTVFSGQLTQVLVALTPWPDGGGGWGVNTPPHITSVSHPTSMASNAIATFSARAVDPDLAATLVYTWSDDRGGTFAGGDAGEPAQFSNQPSGEPVSVQYTPPADFVGTAVIRLTVWDGAAFATTTFPIGVGSGIDVSLVFDVLPVIQIFSVSSQDLKQGEQALLGWALVYPPGAGPDASTQFTVETAWTDSCGGTFDVPTGSAVVRQNQQPADRWVTYTAPPPGAPGSGLCELRLTVTSQAGSSAWSRAYAWVTPVAPVAVSSELGGGWSGLLDTGAGVFDAIFILEQHGADVTGTYFNNGGFQGAVSGTVSGGAMAFTITAGLGCNGSYAGTASLAAPDRLQVSLSGATDCEGSLSATGQFVLIPRAVFVTDAGVSSGNLGGLDGADALCNAAASASGSVVPGGNYKAFLSAPGVNARDRVVNAVYYIPGGTVVANSKADLLDGSLLAGITLDEFGEQASGWGVWTGSLPDGSVGASHCQGWTSSDGGQDGVTGDNSSLTSGAWLDMTSPWSCNMGSAIYCFQQYL